MPWKQVVGAPQPPQRPSKNSCGTLGRPINLTTNFFPVAVANKKILLYHYDVTIKDFSGKEDIPKRKKLTIFEKMKECFPRVFKIPLGYDSMKNAYSVELIPQLKTAQNYEVNMKPEAEDDPRKPAAGENAKKKVSFHKYSISLVLVNKASLADLFSSMVYTQGKKSEIPSLPVQMMEVMFQHYRAQYYTRISSRSFFSLTGEFANAYHIGGGKESVTGFFASLRPATWKDGSIMLNLDMAHTAFYKRQSVMDFLKETQSLTDRDFYSSLHISVIRTGEKALKNLKIRVTHAQRTYRFLRFTPEGADRLQFKLESENGSKMITVENYMKEKYRVTLKYAKVNCVQVGNPDKRIYIPLELCEIDKGQKVMKKLSDTEVATMIRSTAVPPHERLRQIQSVARRNNFNKDPMIKALGFTISDMPLKTMGRVLPPPNLTMQQKNFQPYQGVWDIRDKLFHVTVPLREWCVLNYAPRSSMQEIQKFIGLMINIGKQRGMTIINPLDIYTSYQPNPEEDLKHYQNRFPNIQLVMCILPMKRYYGAIKTAGDTVLNLITQCVMSTNVFKAQPQTVGNILLKINAKLGGVNNVVSAHPQFRTGLLNFAEPFIIMGADVNHPPAGNSQGMPSLVAVVGSYDLHATKYAVERRMQKERTEIISDLTEITINLLKNFHKNTGGKKPNRIIMYRDGVSESQFREVLASEMKAMRKACKTLNENYKPGITFICVQKRHHTRFFCDEKEGIGKSKNVPPGTIVDKDITHPTEIDFYLCSHQGIQGTSRPTHYHILWDDNDLPIDELQMLTYRLCHVYSRCARAVSIPTPVYYAHLAAFRAKVYVQEMLGDRSESGSTVSGEGPLVSEIEIRRTAEIKMSDPLSNRLHYI